MPEPDAPTPKVGFAAGLKKLPKWVYVVAIGGGMVAAILIVRRSQAAKQAAALGDMPADANSTASDVANADPLAGGALGAGGDMGVPVLLPSPIGRNPATTDQFGTPGVPGATGVPGPPGPAGADAPAPPPPPASPAAYLPAPPPNNRVTVRPGTHVLGGAPATAGALATRGNRLGYLGPGGGWHPLPAGITGGGHAPRVVHQPAPRRRPPPPPPRRRR